MKKILTINLLFLTIIGYGQEHYIDSKRDTSFSFTLTSECKNVLDYSGITQGISNRFTQGDGQILELTIIKNCGQTTVLNISSLIDSIVILRTDTGELTTCQCFQKCTLTIDNVFDSVAFNMFGSNEYLINPFYSYIPENQSEKGIDLFYHNYLITIVGEVYGPIKIRLINQIGQEIYNKEFNGNSIIIPNHINGFFICKVIGDKKMISKNIYID
ncbi:MAG: hypothetical protein JXC36_05875 [Candidatus Atribacteria bacterium]|nr:hypothetical protein [Candidatus Atribacteria bacterium]